MTDEPTSPGLSSELSSALAGLATFVNSSVLLRTEHEVYEFTRELAEANWQLQLLCREAHKRRLEELAAAVRTRMAIAGVSNDSTLDDDLAALGL